MSSVPVSDLIIRCALAENQSYNEGYVQAEQRSDVSVVSYSVNVIPQQSND